MSSSAAAELSAAVEAVAGYRRRVIDLVGPQLGPNRDDLVSAIYEAERSLRTAERLLHRAMKLADAS
jgi:ferric-dicitrate binding protein FerR (iron transport regulator)